MVKINVDFRFVEFPYELWFVEEHIKLLEANLESILKHQKARFRNEFDLDDEADRQTVFHFESQLDEGVATRVLVAAPLFAAWATFESTLATVTTYAQRQRELELGMNHLRGGFLQRFRRYSRDVLNLEIRPEDTDWTALERIAELRHFFAHANGRLADMKDQKQRDRMLVWAQAQDGLEEVDGYIVPSVPYVRATFNLLSIAVNRAIESVRHAFPGKSKVPASEGGGAII